MASDLATSIKLNQRPALAKAITLAESQKTVDQQRFRALLHELLPHTGNSIRIGITGAPGVGKSTLIEALGEFLTAQGKTVAVLSIDPSSRLTKGSILGDKTRMEKLSKNPRAFIRPSASRSFLGGVAHATREAILLCESAGFEIIIIETVGVGQSEVSVKDLCDCFLLLMLAGAGDELQGIKKGIMEMADLVAITKADGENIKPAQVAQAEYQHALHLLGADVAGWSPSVLTCSAQLKYGIDLIWAEIERFIDHQRKTGLFEVQRNKQQEIWLQEQLNAALRQQLTQQDKFSENWGKALDAMLQNKWTVFEAVGFLINPGV